MSKIEVERRGYRPKEFCARWGIGMSTLYRKFREGEIRPIKIGPSTTIITVEEETRWLAASATPEAA
jgi:predicted site-specific integrase-resolvase